MNFKALRRLVAALVFGSLATSAIAEGLGEHPAVAVARTWDSRGIDPNSVIVLQPASPRFLAESHTLGEHPAVIVARTWETRGIDPNTFIVLHPAAPQFLAGSEIEEVRVATSTQGTVRTQ